MTTRRPSLSQHLRGGGTYGAGAPPEITRLLEAIAAGAKRLAREVRRAALSGETGLAGETNPSGEWQKKLDIVADRVMIEALAATDLVAAVVSEELEQAKPLAKGVDAGHVVCIDPLDGSSNSDINGAVGTIFGIHRRQGSGPLDPARDALRRGSEQVAAGYVMYGPSTVLVETTGRGVFGFTLDEERDEFLLTHDTIRCPARGHYYSANLGNFKAWHPNLRAYIEHITALDPPTRRPYSLRYTGALVADLHRSLLEGGLYFYPADAKNRDGKLRLLYECAPLALVAEQAGGRASTGTERILDIRPESIHQRVPLVIGSAADVALYERFTRDGRPE